MHVDKLSQRYWYFLSFMEIFPNDSFSFQSIAAPSNVSDQPFGEEETRQGSSVTNCLISLGSINRVMNAQQRWKEEHDELPEFIVGLEVLVEEGIDYRVE